MAEMNSKPDDRRGADRRRRPTGPLDALRPSGRCARVRREKAKGEIAFLDRFPARILALVIGVLAMTLLDGVLTLELLDTTARRSTR